MVPQIMVNISPGSDSLPVSTKLLLNQSWLSQMSFCGIRLRPISQDVFKILIHKTNFKWNEHYQVDLPPHLQGANDFKSNFNPNWYGVPLYFIPGIMNMFRALSHFCFHLVLITQIFQYYISTTKFGNNLLFFMLCTLVNQVPFFQPVIDFNV